MRKVGVEIEYPVVDKNGMAFPVSRIFPVLIGKEWIPEFDDVYKDEIIAVSKNGKVVTSDAGEGILEVNEPPVNSLFEAEKSLNELISFLAGEFNSLEAKILGFGAQPFEKKNKWARKGRYKTLLSIGFSPSLNKTTRTAASQVHIDVKEEEIYKAVNVLNALSGIAIAFCANSSVMNGEDNGRLAKREAVWGEFAPERSGVPPVWFKSNNHLFSFLEDMKFVLTKSNGNYFIPGISFKEFASGLSLEEKTAHYLYHEGTVWFSCRPRLKYGTVEFRPCCTQPHNESMAVSAFALGIVECLEEVHSFTRELYYDFKREGFSFRCLRKNAIEYGFYGVDPGLLKDVLFFIYKGLKKRNKGEEFFADILFERMKKVICPAMRAATIKSEDLVRELAF